MTTDRDITVDGVNLQCEIEYNVFYDRSVPKCVIDSIRAGDIDVIELVSDKDLCELQEKLIVSYENHQQREWTLMQEELKREL
jgi:hypothetical protein